MPNNTQVIWLRSEEPDVIEAEVLARISPLSVTVVSELQEAVDLSRSGGAKLVVANFSRPDLAVSAVELLRSQNELAVVFVRDHFASHADIFALAQLGVTRIFSAEYDIERISNEIEIASEEIGSQRNRSVERVRPAWQCGIIGISDAILQICEIVRLVADRRSTVLISGETGTGKEVIARALHQASQRSTLPMVSLNCTAIPENLLEAELFGYVRGAFTGANQHRVGRFEQAHKSTLFLDEIGDMPLDLQGKLLRVLQEREFQRLGSSETVKVDVRIIAASNLDLLERVRQGLFREDLYYRLNVVPLCMPSLRARPEDIPALTNHFVAKICREEGMPAKSLTASVLPKLTGYSWPGNVRQLENSVEMAVVMSGNRSVLTGADFRLPSSVASQAPSPATAPLHLPDHGMDFEQAVSQFERNILSQALRRSGGNKKLAADMLGLKRTTLSAKVRILETTMGCALA